LPLSSNFPDAILGDLLATARVKDTIERETDITDFEKVDAATHLTALVVLQ
jgi:hypothetical protein